jgi:hypothetical protein
VELENIALELVLIPEIGATSIGMMVPRLLIKALGGVVALFENLHYLPVV